MQGGSSTRGHDIVQHGSMLKAAKRCRNGE